MTFVSQILAWLTLKQSHLASCQIATIGIGIVPNVRSRITGVYGAGIGAGIDEWGDLDWCIWDLDIYGDCTTQKLNMFMNTII
jgi:hypothetical protein